MYVIERERERERPVQNSVPLDTLQLESRHRMATSQALIGRPDLPTINMKSKVGATSTTET